MHHLGRKRLGASPLGGEVVDRAGSLVDAREAQVSDLVEHLQRVLPTSVPSSVARTLPRRN